MKCLFFFRVEAAGQSQKVSYVMPSGDDLFFSDEKNLIRAAFSASDRLSRDEVLAHSPSTKSHPMAEFNVAATCVLHARDDAKRALAESQAKAGESSDVLDPLSTRGVTSETVGITGCDFNSRADPETLVNMPSFKKHQLDGRARGRGGRELKKLLVELLGF